MKFAYRTKQYGFITLHYEYFYTESGQVIKKCLGLRDKHLFYAESLESAIQKLQTAHPDVILYK